MNDFALHEYPDSNFCVKPKQYLTKLNEIVSNKVFFYLEDADKRKVTFTERTMTFALLSKNIK